MTKMVPWRRRAESLLDKGPFEDFFRGFFDRDPFNGMNLPAAFTANEWKWLPATDISETENEVRFAMELPGMDEKDIDIQLQGNQLIVAGEKKQESEKKGKRFHRTECTYGTFQRTFQLPDTVRKDPESIEAKFKKGMLEITIKKLEPEPAKGIRIRSE